MAPSFWCIQSRQLLLILASCLITATSGLRILAVATNGSSQPHSPLCRRHSYKVGTVSIKHPSTSISQRFVSASSPRAGDSCLQTGIRCISCRLSQVSLIEGTVTQAYGAHSASRGHSGICVHVTFSYCLSQVRQLVPLYSQDESRSEQSKSKLPKFETRSSTPDISRKHSKIGGVINQVL